MTPTTAETKLAERKRKKRRTGPAPLSFTSTECEAVRALAACGHSGATIAVRAGLSPKQFKTAREKDERLDSAFAIGRAEEKLAITQALLKTATDPKNPRQVQAAISLLKLRHGYRDGAQGGVDVNVTNVLALPSPQDTRAYTAVLKRVAKTGPALIEHEEPDREMRREPLSIGEIIGARTKGDER